MTAELVAVSGIAAGGDGVGRLADGRAVFLPRTAPGERVRVREGSLRVHRRFARGEAAEILDPARDRVAPKCPHYAQDRCGGCQLQHLDYAAQLAAKRTIVGEALRRIGKVETADPDIVAAERVWRYRSKISLAARRVAGRLRIGLHPYDRPDSVFALVDCHITDLRVMALWRDLQPHLDLLPEGMTRLTLRLDREATRHLIVESPGEPWRTAEQVRAALAGGEDGDVVCWWHPTRGAARVVAGPATGFPTIAFEQVHPSMGAAARRWAVATVEEIRDVVAWDLYGGIGDTALLLATGGAQVVSVDADEQAIRWARLRPEAIACGDRLRFIAGRVEDVFPSLPAPQVVIVSPPRAGLHWDLVLRLVAEPVPRLVYVSCDPATLARDLHRLSVNYHIRSVRAFDQFPQTAHVETVVQLEAAT